MGEENDIIEFVTNTSDLSTDKGFQFEFFCNRCGSGYRTRFKAWTTGTVAGVLEGAGSLFGGIFGQAADIGERVRSAGWQKARDEAFQEAMKEIRPKFIQCPRCNSWVCRKKCWNEKRGLCKDDAPDLGVEMSAAQAERSVEEIHAHAAMAEEDKKLAEGNWREVIRATCPQCEEPLDTNARFCPGCGAELKPKNTCPKCGEKVSPKARFCQGCGAKIA
jgi:hypothetical protein